MSMFYQEYNEIVGKYYYCSRSSLIAALKECIADMEERGIGKDIKFVDFDSHAEIRELEQFDIVGLQSFSFREDNGTTSVAFFVNCSTMRDLNGIRLSKIIGYMFSRLCGCKSIKVINEDQQVISSLDLSSSVEIMPMSKSDGRMVQKIDIIGYLSSATR